jgi:hypothetical protein
MLCQKYVIKLNSIEKRHAGAGEVIGHQLIVQGQHHWMKMPAATMTV